MKKVLVGLVVLCLTSIVGCSGNYSGTVNNNPGETDARITYPTQNTVIDESGYDNYVLVIGDSIALGMGNCTGVSGNLYITDTTGLKVMNLAVGGWRSDQLKDLLVTDHILESTHAKAIIVNIGLNDLAQGKYAYQITPNVQWIIDTVSANHKNLLIINNIMSTNLDGNDQQLYNNWLATKSCHNNVRNLMIGINYTTDGVHPDQANYRRMIDYTAIKINGSL